MRKFFVLLGWLIGNLTSVGLLAFADNLTLRVIGWLWISVAISLAGLVSVGGLFGIGKS